MLAGRNVSPNQFVMYLRNVDEAQAEFLSPAQGLVIEILTAENDAVAVGGPICGVDSAAEPGDQVEM